MYLYAFKLLEIEGQTDGVTGEPGEGIGIKEILRGQFHATVGRR